MISNLVAIAFYVLFALGIGFGARRVPDTRSSPEYPAPLPRTPQADR